METIKQQNKDGLTLSSDANITNLEALEDKIQGCQLCNLCVFDFNKLDIAKGFGKLLGWKGGDKKIKYFFVGLNPSYNRYENLKYAFGGKDFTKGTGIEFVKILKDIGIIEESYVTNLVKCSSYDNDISESNFKTCVRYFKMELDILKPEKIIALGKRVDYFLNNFNTLSANVKYESIWHPNYPISYKREKMAEYAEKIRKVTCG